MTQQQARKSERAAAPAISETETSNASETETDSLLDEIDTVLEKNAEEFVRAYTQKGGQ